MTTKYKCLHCHYTWTMAKPEASGCLKCGHLYVSWTNFAEWKKAPGKSLRWLKAEHG